MLLQKVGELKEPIGVFEKLFVNNATTRILYYFISRRFHSYSVDQVSRDLELSKEIMSESINQLEKRDIVRRDKRRVDTNGVANDLSYTLYVESMTANVVIRAAIEITNAERMSFEKHHTQQQNDLQAT